MVDIKIWSQGLSLGILFTTSAVLLTLAFAYVAKNRKIENSVIPILSTTSALLTLIVMGFIISRSKMFLILFIPMFLLSIIFLWKNKISIKNQIKTNKATLFYLIIFSFPMYLFTALTTLRPIHRDGVNIFLLSQELASSKFIAYPIGLPSIENLFFLVQKSALYINFYGATLGYIGLVFSIFILKPFLEKEGLNLFVILNSVFVLGPVSIFRIGNTTISIVFPLFLGLLLVLYNRINSRNTSNFYSLIALITITFSLIAPHVLISIIPFIILIGIIFYKKLRILLLINISLLILTIGISVIYVQSKIYGTTLVNLLVSSFAVLDNIDSSTTITNSPTLKNSNFQIFTTLVTDFLARKGPIRLPNESLYISGLYLIFILTALFLIYGQIKKNKFLQYFSLFNILLLGFFFFSIWELTDLKGRNIHFIIVLFTVCISCFFSFLKIKKFILLCALGTALTLNINDFFDKNLVKRDIPYKLSFDLFKDDSKQLQIYSQLDHLKVLYPEHIFYNDVNDRALDFDYLFLNFYENESDLRYSGNYGIEMSYQDYYLEVRKNYALNQTINLKILEMTKDTHKVLYEDYKNFLILEKFTESK